MSKLNPKDYVARMRCTECGHEYTLTPAAVLEREGGGVSRWFGSAYDFCEKCDGVPREVKQEPAK